MRDRPLHRATRGWWVALALSATTLLSVDAARARAQTGAELVGRGVIAYEEGELERARTLFAQAEARSDLRRDDVVRILQHRVFVAQALGDQVELEANALRLVTLEPDGLGSAASPQLRREIEAAMARADGVVRLRLEHTPSDGGVEVRARVMGDAGGLVQEVRLRARRAGGDWPRPVSGVVVVDAPAEEVEVFAEAIGPGGAPLATLGALNAPAPLTSPEPEPDPALTVEPDDESGGSLALPIVLGAIGVAVVGAVVAVVLVTTGGGGQADSDVGLPMVQW